MEPRIIVIGGSAGSVGAVVEIVRALPRELNAAVFIVLHSMPRERNHMPEILTARGQLPAQQTSEGARIKAGEIYVVPPDRHLVIAEGHVHISRGPKEGLNRPSINVTFRSAAVTYGERVIGVLLSGMLDDGAAGIWEIANRGGITIVQDPEDAQYPSMPLNALRDAPVDYRLTAAEIGPLLPNLVNGTVKPTQRRLPEDEGGRIFTGFTCPECRGPLYQSAKPGPVEFECRVGHVISLKTLVEEETSTQEKTLYQAIVALQEGADLAEYAATRMTDVDVEALRREAEQLRKHADTIRSMIEERVAPSVS
ncbi:chemotaxis protein CheB [Terriglobus albidus]|uniref:chemotaxis protein CheB n=1 Tax=Terriglobus albidus TaxID=1592106 RepID=UPI0021DFAFD0|nr:chemotaxis protein CheB [Terriglobus albidus]